MPAKYEIDKIDRQILSLLLEDARMPYTEIAERIKVSSGTIHGRIKKLQRRKIIKGATLTINYETMGYGFTAYVGIILDRTLKSDQVITNLKKIPEVTVAHIASGQYGIFCKVRCRDTRQAKDVIFEINGISGILRTETMISLEEAFNDNDRLFKSLLE
jgi:Lrp/AsnC family transcriptional regulator for asnA, asnC and gidA